MDIRVTPNGRLYFAGTEYRCAFGRAGVRRQKTEGDGATPAGVWPLRRVLYRKDRIEPPRSALPTAEIAAAAGWCDDPRDAAYNRPVTLPYPASAEGLWRDDHLYDVIVVLGYNDAPVVPGSGSAVFFHLADASFAPTAGCVAVSLVDMRSILEQCNRQTRMAIEP